MALQSKELFGPKVTQLPNLRAFPHEGGISVAQMAALGANADVAHLTPMSLQDANGFWAIWSGAENAEYTIISDSSPATAGDFTLTFVGETTAPIAFNATAAVIQAAIEALGGVDIGDVSAVATAEANLGVADATVTITFSGGLSGVDVNGSGDFAGLVLDAEYTLTSDGTPATAGDFTLTFLGETTAAIVFDATAAIVQAAIEALGAVDLGDVTCVDSGGGSDLGDASHIVTITFGAGLAGLDVSGVYTDNTTGNDHVLAEVDEGGAAAGTTHVLAESTEGGGSDIKDVDALLWAPDVAHAGLAAGETMIQLLKRGVVHAGDIVLPAGESQSVLDAALKAMSLRQKGLTIQGLAGVA